MDLCSEIVLLCNFRFCFRFCCAFCVVIEFQLLAMGFGYGLPNGWFQISLFFSEDVGDDWECNFYMYYLLWIKLTLLVMVNIFLRFLTFSLLTFSGTEY